MTKKKYIKTTARVTMNAVERLLLGIIVLHLMSLTLCGDNLGK